MRPNGTRSILAVLLTTGATVASAQTVPETSYGNLDEPSAEVIEAEATQTATTFTNQTGGEAQFYGQFSPTFQSFNDSKDYTTGIVDNGNWNTRLGVRITQPFDGGTLRFRVESSLGLRSSAAVSQGFDPDWLNWQRTSLRWFEAALDTDYGTISVGQGSSATDGTATLDVSETFVAGSVDESDGFGSFRLRDGNGRLTGIAIGDIFDSFDGARLMRVRYDTPRLNGFMVSTSYGQNVLVSGIDTDFYDVALRWSGDLGDVAVEAAAGYGWANDPNGENLRRVSGSVTAFHDPTGLNLSVSSGSQIDGPAYVYVKPGWKTQVFAAGDTAMSVDYYYGTDFLTSGATSEAVGISAVQSFDAYSIDVHAGWRRFMYSDDLPGSYEDADGLLVGARWYF